MQSPWPLDGRVTPQPARKRAGRKKYIPPSRTVQREDVPNIQIGGTSAITLINRGQKLEWECLVDGDDESSHPAEAFRQGIQVYPKSASEAPNPPEITAYRRAEQSARFLREFYPDLDIPFEVLQDLLADDPTGPDKGSYYDPYVGNGLVALTIGSGKDEAYPSPHLSLLLFVTGEAGSCLTASAFGEYDGEFAPLIACPTILKDFEKPILQVIGSSTSDTIAVRTPNDLQIYQLDIKQRAKNNQPPVSIQIVGTIELGPACPKPFMDMMFEHDSNMNSTATRLILVDELGQLWRWSLDAENPIIELLIKIPIENTPKYALSADVRHWRIASSGIPGLVYVVSGRFIGRVDSRGDAPSYETIFELHPNDGILTSITPTAVDFTLCAATTTKLFWINVLSGKVVAAWRHDRQSEPGLQVVWMPGATDPEACLYSPKNNLVSTYPMTWATSQPSTAAERLRILTRSSVPTSFILSSSQNVSRQNARKGFQLFRHPLQDTQKDISFDAFELTSTRAVFRTRFSDTPSAHPDEAMRVWSEEVHAMQAAADGADRSDARFGPLGMREAKEYDLRSLYTRLFLSSPGDDEDALENSAVASRDPNEILQRLSSFAPRSKISTLLTFHDIARRAAQGDTGGESDQRSNLLTNTIFHSEAGHEALREAYESMAVPPVEALAEATAWHWNISETLGAICGQSTPIPSRLQDLGVTSYRKFDVSDARMAGKSPAIKDREHTSARTLVVDLATSLDVFATSPVTDDSKKSALMETTTIMMSKSSISAFEPPPINFGFLKPNPANAQSTLTEEAVEGHATRRKRKKRRSSPVGDPNEGARLLLSEWQIGDDPRGVKYTDPYNLTSEPPDKAKATPVRGAAPVVRSAPPETLFANATEPLLKLSKVPKGRIHEHSPFGLSTIQETHGGFGVPASQPELKGGRASGTQPIDETQSLVPSTQPVSGIFGTRPATTAAKKKKRVSGF